MVVQDVLILDSHLVALVSEYVFLPFKAIALTEQALSLIEYCRWDIAAS